MSLREYGHDDDASLQTVTFVLSDIEGSTELLKRLGERHDELIAAHRRASTRASRR